jgi:hypothetical protein
MKRLASTLLITLLCAQLHAGTAQQSLLANVSLVKLVTIGTDGGPPIFSGYSAAAGSLAPSTTVKSATLANVGSAIGEYNMRITLTGAGSATFFRALRFQDAGGTFQTLTAASASYSSDVWSWGDGSSPYWSASDNTEVKIVEIMF